MIVAQNLTKRFATFAAIEDVSFHVGRGEIVGLLGPNGAGKSTTMRIMAGVFPPSSGKVTIAGYDVVRESLRARSVVGYFPERVALYLDMAVRHYLRYVAEMKGLSDREARRQAEVAIESCALGPVGQTLIGSLSKGFRQRVGIAQALVGSPRVLILDEPSAGLDPEQVAEMRKLIRGLGGDRSVILSTHILPEVESTCDRVIILHHGRVVAVDTPAKLNQRLRDTSQIDLEVTGPELQIVTHLRTIPGVLDISVCDSTPDGTLHLRVTTNKEIDLRNTLAAAIIERGWGLRELRFVRLSLEEIFLSLVSPTRPTEARHEDAGHLSS